MARKPALTFNNPQKLSDSPMRPRGAGGRRPPLASEGNGFSFAMDEAELNMVPTFIKEPPITKKVPLATSACINYESDELLREHRGAIPREGYDIDNPSARIVERPNLCKDLPVATGRVK